MNLRGDVICLIGCDVAAVVLQNPWLDKALVINDDNHIDLPDHSVDLVVSSATFEHVLDSSSVAIELTRVPRPGGRPCVWTPNRHGYIALPARMIPTSWHTTILRRLQDPRTRWKYLPNCYRLTSSHRSPVSSRLPGPITHSTGQIHRLTAGSPSCHYSTNYFRIPCSDTYILSFISRPHTRRPASPSALTPAGGESDAPRIPSSAHSSPLMTLQW